MAIRFILQDLDREWATITNRNDAKAALLRWRDGHPCFGSVADLGELIEAIRHGPFEESTELTWALLDLAQHDRLASRCVLQAIVPGLGGQLRWLLGWARTHDPSMLRDGDIDQLLVTSALEAVAHAAGTRRAWPLYSILRRTQRILRKSLDPEASWRATTALGDATDHPLIAQDETAAVELRVLLDEADKQGALSRQDVGLIWLTRVAGFQPNELEDRYSLCGDSLRRRRHRAEARLAEFAEAV